MEAKRSIVRRPFFIHALKMNTESMLSLRTLSSVMNDMIIKSLFSLQTLELHEAKYQPNFVDYVKTAKLLTIEGITLSESTAAIFEDFKDRTLERLECLELSISADESSQDACVRIASVMARFQSLHKLVIRVWRDSDITDFFAALNELTDASFFATVKYLTLCINEDVIKESNHENIEEFVGKFTDLRTLNSSPRDGFNPFAKVDVDHLESIVVDTPNTNKELALVSEFITKSKCKHIELMGIQADELTYDNCTLPETLIHLKLDCLSNVDVSSILNTLPPALLRLEINDVNMKDEVLKHFIIKLEELTSLQELQLSNCETVNQELFINFAKALSTYQNVTLLKLDLSCNHIEPATLSMMAELFPRLIEFSITNLRNLQDYKLEDILKCANLLVRTEKAKLTPNKDPVFSSHALTFKFSDYYFDFLYEGDRETAKKIIDEDLSPHIFLKLE